MALLGGANAPDRILTYNLETNVYRKHSETFKRNRVESVCALVRGADGRKLVMVAGLLCKTEGFKFDSHQLGSPV